MVVGSPSKADQRGSPTEITEPAASQDCAEVAPRILDAASLPEVVVAPLPGALSVIIEPAIIATAIFASPLATFAFPTAAPAPDAKPSIGVTSAAGGVAVPPPASSQTANPPIAALDRPQESDGSNHRHGASSPNGTATPIEQDIPSASSREGIPTFALPALHDGAMPAVTAARAPPPASSNSITAQPGQIGHELGVAIAHHIVAGDTTGGSDTITLRLNPIDMGRIEVKLSFDDAGTLRAVVSADNPAALDMLRRDSADLGRALADAGVRADTQTLRFDTRAGADQGGGQNGSNGQPWRRQSEPGSGAMTDTDAVTTDDITATYRPLRPRGGIDMVA